MKKSIKSLAIAGLCVLLGGVNAVAQDATTELKKAAETFVKGADEQSTEMLEAVLHEDAMQYVVFGPRLLKSTAGEYVAQIAEKKIGGKPREITFGQVLVEGDNAGFVQLKAVGGGLSFAYFITMVKPEAEWKIASITAKVTMQQ